MKKFLSPGEAERLFWEHEEKEKDEEQEEGLEQDLQEWPTIKPFLSFKEAERLFWEHEEEE